MFNRLFRRSLLSLTLLAGASLCSAAVDGGVKIVRVYTGWRDAGSFKRISEYFDGKEHIASDTTLVRTQPDQRGGYYFLVRVNNPGAATATRIEIQLIMPNNLKPKTITFNTNLAAGSAVLDLGLTGADWPDAKTNPIAWKLDLLTSEGQVLATQTSYLWEKPAAK